MPDAVIVATGRTPIGRAFKGSLVECRPDDLAALAIKEVVAKVPQLDPAEIEDVILGCGQPGGESGFNIARVAALIPPATPPTITILNDMGHLLVELVEIRRFHGIRASSNPIPQKSVTPAKISPAPMKAHNPKNPGWTSHPSDAPIRIRTPAAIRT